MSTAQSGIDHQSPTPSTWQLQPLSALMGAAVTGLDLRKPLDEATRNALQQVFLDYQLLVFREQNLDKAQQIAFSEQFGVLEEHRAKNRGADDFPLLHVVSNLGEDGLPSGKVSSTAWHTDKSFRPAPAQATILHARSLPPNGGDTCFANMYAAYEALDDTAKKELADVRVVHSWPMSREHAGRDMPQSEIDANPAMSHALVRVHPQTGRKALYLGIHAAYLEDQDFEQGRARILELEAHSTQAQFVYRHDWQQGDMIMWDNRCLLHRADPDFDARQYPRIMHRTCLVGTPTQGQRIAREPVHS